MPPPAEYMILDEGECLVRHYTKKLNDVKVLQDQDVQTRHHYLDPAEIKDEVSLILEKTEELHTSFNIVNGNLNRVLYYNKNFESVMVCLWWFLIALLVICSATLVFVLLLWVAKMNL